MYRPWIIPSTGTPRNFGVELEFNEISTDRTPISTGDCANALIAAGIARSRVRNVGGYAHNDGSQWYTGRDGSAGSAGGYGNEVTTPILQMDNDGHCAELRTGMNALAALNPRINGNCGLHVHVDLPDFTWEEVQKLIALWARYEPFFFELLPPSRWNNGFCQPLRSSRWTANNGAWSTTEATISATTEREFTSAGRSLPRGSVNLAHWWYSRRIEFRLGAGTMSYDKVRNWVVLLMALVNRVKLGESRHGGMSPVSKRVGAGRGKTFSTHYIGMALGIAPSKWIPAAEIHPASVECVRWINERREKFAAHFARHEAGESIGGRSQRF